MAGYKKGALVELHGDPKHKEPNGLAVVSVNNPASSEKMLVLLFNQDFRQIFVPKTLVTKFNYRANRGQDNKIKRHQGFLKEQGLLDLLH
jgi:hypothetical protein